MTNTLFDPMDLVGLQQWRQEESGDNTLRIDRLRRNLPIALREQLTPRQRQMVEMHYFRGKNVTAIAAELGVNKSTVSRSLRRSRELLQQSLRYSL